MYTVLLLYLKPYLASCNSSCNSSCKDVVKTASLRLTLFAYISIGICFLWWILSHTAERGWQQSLWLRTSSNVFHSHWISSSFLHANIKWVGACVCVCVRVCVWVCVFVCVCVCVCVCSRKGKDCTVIYYTILVTAPCVRMLSKIWKNTHVWNLFQSYSSSPRIGFWSKTNYFIGHFLQNDDVIHIRIWGKMTSAFCEKWPMK